MDLYKVLGVARGATVQEIKKAYRGLALSLHPDVTGNDVKKTEQFKSVQKAYEVLADEKGRALYDSSGGGVGQSSGFAYGGYARAVRNPRRRSSSPVDPRHFNEQVWYESHYGDVVFSRQIFKTQGAARGRKETRNPNRKSSHSVNIDFEFDLDEAVLNLNKKRDERKKKSNKKSDDCVIA